MIGKTDTNVVTFTYPCPGSHDNILNFGGSVRESNCNNICGFNGDIGSGSGSGSESCGDGVGNIGGDGRGGGSSRIREIGT